MMTVDLSRRQAMALGAGAALSLPRTLHAAVAPGADTLKGAAQAGRLTFGAAGGEELTSDLDFRALFVRQAAILTPDHALKFDALQPQRGRFDFAPADALVDGARGYGLGVHGHTLIWNDWPPDWLKALPNRDAAREFDIYLEKVVPYFAGRVDSWDVVNEPFWLGLDKPGTFRPGVWYDALGPNYIYRAFRRTSELDPRAKLVLNEAWTERTDPVGLAVRRSLLELIDRMQEKGVPLDAVGLQGHLTPQIPYDDASFADFLHEIGRRGLDIRISEFDVDDHGFSGTVEKRDAAVAARTRAFLDAVLAVPSVKTVIAWGLSDRYTWWREPSVMSAYGLTRLPRPLPYDDLLERKPMWTAMADAFRRRGARTLPPG